MGNTIPIDWIEFNFFRYFHRCDDEIANLGQPNSLCSEVEKVFLFSWKKNHNQKARQRLLGLIESAGSDFVRLQFHWHWVEQSQLIMSYACVKFGRLEFWIRVSRGSKSKTDSNIDSRLSKLSTEFTHCNETSGSLMYFLSKVERQNSFVCRRNCCTQRKSKVQHKKN